jgi:hypothetical protein
MLAGGANHRFSPSKNAAPAGAAEIMRHHSTAPPGLVALFIHIRWLAPPANFRHASGVMMHF